MIYNYLLICHPPDHQPEKSALRELYPETMFGGSGFEIVQVTEARALKWIARALRSVRATFSKYHQCYLKNCLRELQQKPENGAFMPHGVQIESGPQIRSEKRLCF